ncbi:DUF1801 domain-containing protein [Flavobacterium sp.]|uniref:DUF1801 domain-containing protein n=1 Tax=Flavobacterium sp. TaxID=239 RepID=UPI0026167CCA|nr:DUF1801 domain-containing protein [Flavobacterium sp.]
MIHQDIINYNNSKTEEDQAICNKLLEIIHGKLFDFENKLWHAHPVWFENGNPIVGYDKLKNGVRLMFWSGASFEEQELKLGSGKFKDASKTYTSVAEINITEVERWLQKSTTIQWDYKNIVKRKGVLERLK